MPEKANVFLIQTHEKLLQISIKLYLNIFFINYFHFPLKNLKLRQLLSPQGQFYTIVVTLNTCLRIIRNPDVPFGLLLRLNLHPLLMCKQRQ